GYFNGVVSDTTIYKKRKKANVIYTVVAGTPYTIRKINYKISDPAVERIVMLDTVSSLLKPGNRFRAPEFQAERERVTNHLRNSGYFEFNQLYISYDIDSALGSNQADVKFIIAGTNEESESGDTTMSGNHKMYRINDVFIQTDFDPLSKIDKIPTDTVEYKGYYFLTSRKKREYNPESLLMRVFIEEGDIYQIK